MTSSYTMTKSTAIIFILGFALAFKLEEKVSEFYNKEKTLNWILLYFEICDILELQHWSIVIIVSLISSGLVMFTYKSNQFELEGFLLVLTASFLR